MVPISDRSLGFDVLARFEEAWTLRLTGCYCHLGVLVGLASFLYVDLAYFLRSYAE